jgi:predicted  nucleic acid-binding Zn-ribbon protein
MIFWLMLIVISIGLYSIAEILRDIHTTLIDIRNRAGEIENRLTAITDIKERRQFEKEETEAEESFAEAG